MDWGKLRQLFPVASRLAYLNNAAEGPCATPVAEAMLRFIEDKHAHGCVNFERWLETQERCRARAARLLNADPVEVGFVKNTTQGLIIAAEALPLGRGDVVLLNDMEFPSNVHPWHLVARKRGAHVKVMPARVGRVTPEMVAQNMSRQVRVLALSSVQYSNGFASDLYAIGEICAAYKVTLVVDAIQSLGVLPVDVRRCRIGILAAGSHKWLMAAAGTGLLFVDKALQDRLLPTNCGWLGVRDPVEFGPTFEPADGARRYEEGNASMVSIFGLEASLALLEEVGVPAVAARVQALCTRLTEGLERKGYQIESPQAPGERSGIVLFRGGPLSAKALHQRLTEAGVVTAVRARGIRVSPHLYNNEDDVDRLLDALE